MVHFLFFVSKNTESLNTVLPSISGPSLTAGDDPGLDVNAMLNR